jgi:Domain of unknown function (DUF5916)
MKSLLNLALLLFLISTSTAEESHQKYELPKMTGTIAVDGDLSDSFWKGSLVIEHFYEISPGDNTTPVVRTVGYLGYDSEFLYVAVYCYDPRPAEIRASYSDRDSISIDQDFVQFDLDTKDDEKSSFLFRVNPRGVVGDAIFSESTGVDDFSPDFSFHAAARIVADGWTVEYRVPLSTLRYAHTPVQTWGITFYRNYPRQFRHRMASNRIPRGANCWLCYDTKLTGIGDLPPSRYALIVPFVTAQKESVRSATSGSDSQMNAGADLKWIPFNNLTLDATINPDFAQVEADVPQINVNNRFALFYPEKRSFFLEGTDLLNTPLNVIYTRTITDPNWGTRGTGRIGNSAYTVLTASDEGGGSRIVPGPVFSKLVPQEGTSIATIARMRHAIGDSLIGFVFTDRENENGFNRVGGPDLFWRPSETNQITGQWLLSRTKDSTVDDSTDYALSLGWLHSESSKFFQIDYQRLGHDFRADNGFVPQVGIERKAGTGGYRFYPNGWLWFIQPGVTWDTSTEIGERLVSRSTFPALTLRGKWNSSFNLEYHIQEKVRTANQIHDHTFFFYDLQLQPSRLVSQLEVKGKIGEQVDVVNERVGDGAVLAFIATLRTGIHLITELQAERQWLNIDGSRLFTADVAQVRITYNFSPRMFLRLIPQYERVNRNVNLYKEPVGPHEGALNGSVLFGYRFNWQTVFYAGYSGDRLLVDGTHYQKNSSHVFVKLAYAFEP